MKNKENQAFRTAFRLLGPLLFYELCTEAAARACSLFGTQDALLVTGGGALLALPFLWATYWRRRTADEVQMQCVPVQNIDSAQYADSMPCMNQAQRAGRVPCLDPSQRRKHLPAGCVCSALAGVGACLCLNVLLQLLLPPSEGWNSTREAVYGTSFVVQVLVTVLLAPLTEELLFRGLIRTELRTHMKPRTAGLLGALLFGLYHGNTSQGIYAFLLALCLELVCEWSGCLLPAVCLHAGANGAAICFTALMSGISEAFRFRTVLSAAAAGAILAAAALYKTKEVFCKS